MDLEKIRNNTIIKFTITGVLAVFLSTVAFCIGQSFSNRMAHDMSYTVEMVRTGDSAITFGDLIKLKNSYEFYHVTGYSELTSGVSNRLGVGETGIKAVMTDAEHASVYNYDMLAGSFPDSQAVDKGGAYAVISDSLAVRLFKTIDIVGSEINVLGKEYTVAGVYKRSGSTLLNMCGDGFDRVFVPYSSVDNYAEVPADVVTLHIEPGQSEIENKTILEKHFGSKVYSYRIIDHSVSEIVMHQYFDLLLFFIGAFAILHTLIFFIKYSIYEARYIKKKSHNFYVAEIIKADGKMVISYISVALLCGICIALLIKSIQFKFIIADRYIPEDNIFDIGFYAKVLMNDIMASNSYAGKAYSILEYIYKNALRVELFCTFMFMIFFCVTLMLQKILLSLGTGILRMLKSYSAIIFAGGIAGICISVLLGLEACLPVKPLIMAAYYLILNSICNAYESAAISQKTSIPAVK